MLWMDSYMSPTKNQAQVLHEQHVLDLITEAILAAQEGLREIRDHVHGASEKDVLNVLSNRVNRLEEEMQPLLGVTAVGVSMSGLVLAVVFVFFCKVIRTLRESSAPPIRSPIVLTPLDEGSNEENARL